MFILVRYYGWKIRLFFVKQSYVVHCNAINLARGQL
ncbi:hypothetical protein T05_8309 [Trichinella murrelli]|uniref:Uncharacterized protein n=1 Tax=Trichinella murrelli TaxID=144512 RepID=A0A0V0SR58_9BILA|nr:hypothetical protein T05_8309 [Trichinella murrelli]